MERRAVLATAVGALGGCTSLLPEQRPPEEAPRRGPNLACAATWDDEDVTITIEMGNRVTAGETRVVDIWIVADAPVQWVGGENPEQSFPLEPGDAITVTADRLDEPVTVGWEGREDSGSSQVCTLEPPGDGPTEGAPR